MFRIVWDVSPEAAITVESPDAPDAILVTPEAMGGREDARIRIGDPDVTVSGLHRYRIDYPLPRVAGAPRSIGRRSVSAGKSASTRPRSTWSRRSGCATRPARSGLPGHREAAMSPRWHPVI
jgi:hypothetical protein